MPLVLASGHALVLASLMASLAREGASIVSAVRDSHALLDRGAARQPEAILLDDWLGFDLVSSVLPKLRRVAPSARTVLLATRNDRETQDAVARGLVDGVVHRTQGLRTVHETLRGVLAGERVSTYPHPVLPASIMSAESVPALSDREEEVLQLLTLGARNARIAEELGISVNTVRTHVSSVLGKLGVDSRGQAAHVAAGASTLRDGPLLMARTMHSSNGTGAPHRRLAIVLVLVDGHRAFVEAVALQLRVTMPGLKVRLARTTEEAEALVGEEVADLVILHDEKRPDDALHGVKELGRRDGAARCLVLSGRDDPTDVVHALRAGSSGWISRDVSLDELDEAIRQVVQDRLYLSPPVLSEVLRDLLVPGPDRRLEHDFVDSLSSRELEILRCLMAGMTRREIAGRLFLSIHTVHSHVKRMLNRAGQHSALSLVAMARQLGVTPIDRDDASPFPTQPRAADGSPLAAN